MTLKVSVVVPVYNPGHDIDALVESLLAQSLPQDEYEVIFADDASTDGTADRLDALAKEHPMMRVLHNSPNSGWPGRPRNLGIDAARGEYVYFVDSDDWLGPEALERMYDFGTANDSDIVCGRVIGHGRFVPPSVFRANRADAKLWKDSLVRLLTVHKMFRASLISSAGLRFPEGRKRLEDHLFVVPAIFAAERISVLADYPCYHWRLIADADHISEGMGDPAEYFTSVREVLDIVEANTEPGPSRDRLLSHWYGGKTLRWFEGAHLVNYSPEYLRELFDTVGVLVEERFPPAIDRYLPIRRRMASELVRRGDFEAFIELVRWLTGIRAVAVADTVRWVDGRLRVRVVCQLEDSAARTLTVQRRGEREFLRLPEDLGVALPAEALDVTGAAQRASLEVHLRNRTTGVSELMPSVLLTGPEYGADEVAELRAVSRSTIDPHGSLLTATSEIHDLFGRLRYSGWVEDARPTLIDQQALDGMPAEFGTVRVTPYGTEFGHLSLRRSTVAPRTPPSAAPPPGRASRLSRLSRGSGGRDGSPDGRGEPSGLRHEAEGDGMTDGPSSGPGRPTRGTARKSTLFRRGLRLLRRLGLDVVDLGPGVAVVSRSGRAPVLTRIDPETDIVSRRAPAPVLTRIDSDLAVVSRRGRSPVFTSLDGGTTVLAGHGHMLEHQELEDGAWLLTDERSSGIATAPTGKRTWVLSGRDLSPQAELALETQTIAHLGTRHVAWLLKRYRIDLVLDVGANAGQFASALRRHGYENHIVSFEPVPRFAEALTEVAAGDDRWTVRQLALGSTDGTAPIHVQGTFSSLLPSSEFGRERFSTLRGLSGTEQVDTPVRRLDGILDELLVPLVAAGIDHPRIYLKMDTQGFDVEVFRGLGERVREIVAMQSEVALLLIYEGMPRMPEALATYEVAGFEITGLYPVTRKNDGRVVEYDATLIRPDAFPV